jgi:hypothetical protein
MAWSKKDLNLISAQNIGVGRAPGGVFAHKLGEHAVFVVSGKVDVLYLNTHHIGHGSSIYKVDIARAVTTFVVTRSCRSVVTRSCGSVVIFPVFHENADDLIALFFKQVGTHGRVYPAA